MKTNFYTQNGWEGSKYEIGKGAKEVAKELRAYIKADPELNVCKWSITSKWGMYADSLTVALMAAPFDPFTEEYKENYAYRYEQRYSEHGTIKCYTTPEAFRLIEKIETFVMHYIHDDSDGQIDYFDRNIYDHYEIGRYDKPFQLIEKKESPRQGKPSNKPNQVKTSEPIATREGLEIVDYSEKAIAVFGETKEIKEQLKEIGGRFNPSLRYNGEKRTGWIFSKKQEDKVRKLFAPSIGVKGKTYQTEDNQKINLKTKVELSDNKMKLRDFVIKYGFNALKGKKILSGENIVYIHEKLFTPEKLEHFKDYNKNPHMFRVYGGESPEDNMVSWIYDYDFVLLNETGVKYTSDQIELAKAYL